MMHFPRPLLETSIPHLGKPKRGKVRDSFDLGDDTLLMVQTDRISAFDWVLEEGIPDKGNVLTSLSVFWFRKFETLIPDLKHHLITHGVHQFGHGLDEYVDQLQNRSMLVRKCEVKPIECVVRGYLDGSGWKEYLQNETVCGIKLPSGLKQGSQLEKPIFTPSTKEEIGHDRNITFEEMVEIVGTELAEKMRQRSLDVYAKGAEYAKARNIIIADTKFEWGTDPKTGELVLIDEVLTPDSSRFWPADQYQPGRSQPSFDKQFVRDWLNTTDWDKNSPPPSLPEEIIMKTREKYIEALARLTGVA